MTKTKATALDGLRKLQQQRSELDSREAELRQQAAAELGQLLLECGAEALEPGKLRQLIRGTMTCGIDTALSRIAAA